jgi:hypothetical protein
MLLAASAIPVVGGLGTALVNALRGKHEHQATIEETAEERFDRQEEGFRKALMEDVEVLRTRLREEELAHRVTAKDRDRGWQLARLWEALAHAVLHYLRSKLQLANFRLEKSGGELVVVEDLSLPGLEELVPGYVWPIREPKAPGASV